MMRTMTQPRLSWSRLMLRRTEPGDPTTSNYTLRLFDWSRLDPKLIISPFVLVSKSPSFCDAGPSVEERAILYLEAQDRVTKGGFTKMALTWATGVRFGRATRRNERKNELHLDANSLRRFGSSSGPKNA
ncbi:hypothetical protein Hanom_Chr08g00744901 [Helianthus anomalus]